jgi:ribonuclease III
MNSNFDQLEQSLNYKFKNISLLEEALSHPSLKQIDEANPNYERFEFLGDSILGFVVTEMIFSKYREYDDGGLAKLKAYVVSHDILVKIAKDLNLADYIIMTAGEENSGGRENSNNLENALEALIAGIYLDSNIDQTRQIVNRLWQHHIENVDPNMANPKSALQEFLQDQNHSIPSYQVIKREGAVHAPIFTVQVKAMNQSANGTGHSIKEAEKNAALKMLKNLQEK